MRLARARPAMSQEELGRASSTSPTRAKLRGLTREVAVVPGSVGDRRDARRLERVCEVGVQRDGSRARGVRFVTSRASLRGDGADAATGDVYGSQWPMRAAQRMFVSPRSRLRWWVRSREVRVNRQGHRNA